MSARDVETLDVLDAAELFGGLIDEKGAMPGDEDYEGAAVEDKEEEVTEEVEEEVEEEAEDEESEDESDEEDKPTEEDKLFEVEIGEDVYEVNEEELKAGYLRNEAYIGRSTELEREYKEKADSLAEKEVQIDAELDALLMLQSSELNKFRNIDWAELKATDPDRYREMRLDMHEAQERSALFNSRKQELQRMRKEAEKVKHDAYVREQQALAAKLVPEFSKPEFQTQLIKYGKEIGYTEDELRGIADARHLMLLNQARLYSEAQLRRKEALEKKVPKEVPKVAKPGTPQAVGKTKAKATQKAAEHFGKSGDVRSAANYFLQAGIFN